MTAASLREDYLRWLEPQLRDEHAPAESYWEVLNLLFDKPFVSIVDYDDNRLADGLALREEFGHHARISSRQLERLAPCSFLEVLIGLSRRLAFVAGGEAPGWAWQLMCNLELHRMSDPLSRRKQEKVDEIMDKVIWRQYAPDGQGGFFPLAWSDDDQTKIELWYQLNAFVGELHPEH